MNDPPRRLPHCPPRGWLFSALAGVVCAALLGGCATRPGLRDGPGANPPPGLEKVPDATPRIEPLRIGGPNKPYTVMGRHYVPLTADLPYEETGGASWYGRKFQGQPTSSGEPYDMYAMTAAHPTLPIPSYARVRNPANGRQVIVRINDRGPFADGRIIDLSYTAALKLGLLGGVAPVEVQRITQSEIRAGLASPAAPAVPPAVATTTATATAMDDPAPGDPPLRAGFWLQLGAFHSRDAATRLQQRVLQEATDSFGVAVLSEGPWYRVQAGPYPSREQAQQAGRRIEEAFGIVALVVERPPQP